MKIYKNILCVLFLISIFSLPACAEKVPVRISPIQIISTDKDAIEVGDWIKFEVAGDVFVNDKLYISNNTDVVGIVDFVHSNGWGGDGAEIYFKKFYTTDVNNKKVVINSLLELKGNSEMANSSRDIPTSGGIWAANFFHIPGLTYLGQNYAGFILRGAEIDIEPDTKTYNLFIEQ